jgi:hypothetical protein
MGIDQQDGSLVWLLARLTIGRPKAGRLESEQVGRRYVARLDAENGPRMQLLAHHWKNTTISVAMERKGTLDGLHDFVGR